MAPPHRGGLLRLARLDVGDDAADVERRISSYYAPYHAALADLLAERRRTFGRAFQLSCHSMSSVGPRDGVRRPEICLGDLDGTTASPGTGIDSVQVELRRDLYLDEVTWTPHGGLARLQECFAAVAAAVRSLG
ncbi:hypothetical protein VT50_0225525 [Streptomyces antioxidans]|uniref:N-formylglutamate amidohydrolase n=1 Tax=Streptomyces antioxidans TaxID=1507734 RepID=A0A1V4D007_9ACTN|nr:N-formylglutamate amidohydrolase [Streptomyces antioxidans]OPF75241.1 hypothetical protein VT50_0225525 [Streptomyces antioxidans]